MGNIKEINIKNRTYYFFDDMINIREFDSSQLKIGKKSYKNIGIYHVRYITMKDSDHVKINSVNQLYFIIGEVDGYIECSSTEENNGNKYLTFTSTDKNKKLPIEYEKDYIKIKLNSDDNLPLNTILKFHMLTVIARSIFEDGKYYPQVFLDECLYEV